MLTIYLDKNVISYLKSKPNSPFAEKLKELVPFVTFPYSRAILSDLCRGYSELDDEKREKVFEDLNLISNLSEGQYLEWSDKDKIVNWYVADIRAMFNEELEIYGRKVIDFMHGLIQPDVNGDTNPVDEILKSVVKFLSTIPMGIDFDELRQTDEGNVIANMLPTVEKSGNFADGIIDVINWIDSLEDAPAKYKELRSVVMRHTHIQDKVIKFDTNAITEIDQIMSDSIIGKPFNEFIVSINKHSENNLDSNFMHEYVMLDMVGYKADKLKKGYTNFLNDCQHSFIGSHCDFFITDDAATLAKSKMMYEKRGLSSIACNIEEFLTLIESYEFNADIKDILNISEQIESWNHIEREERDGVILDEYYLKPRFLNYFNKINVLREKDRTISYTLFHSPENYLVSCAFVEIEKMVNYLHSILGSDFRNRSKYIPEEENQKVYDREWSGRKWIFENGKKLVYFSMLKDDIFPRVLVVDETGKIS